MKHLLLPVAWFLFGVSLLLADEKAAGGNPLPNPGFEEGDKPTWVINDDVSRTLPQAARSGKLGLRTGAETYNPGGGSVTSVRFPVTAQQEVGMSFWARSQGEAVGVYFSFLSPAGKMVAGGGYCPVKNTAGEWKEHSLKAKAPEGAAFVTIWIHAYAGAIGVADLDDFVLSGIAPGAAWAATPPARPRAAAFARATTLPATLPARKVPPVIILKLDDLKIGKGGHVHPVWRKLADYLGSRNIKAGFGVICETLPQASPEDARWFKELHDAGRVEFWLHGWDHGTHMVGSESHSEFSGRSYDEQRERFQKAQAAAKDKLGFAFNTFGPPGGGTTGGHFDDATVRVMSEDPDMKVWLYPKLIDEAGRKLEAQGKVVILDRVRANLESLVGVPDYVDFVSAYAGAPDREYFVLQGHPGMWNNPERFGEFVKIIDFLVSQKAIFTTPRECAELVKRH